MKNPLRMLKNSRSEDMFSTVSFSELEEPFSHTQQFDSIDDSTCSNSTFARVSMLQVDKAIFQPDMPRQSKRTDNRMVEPSQTEPLHDGDVVSLAQAEDMSGCKSLTHVLQGLGSRSETNAWL